MMISYVKGILAEAAMGVAIVEAGGIGYKILIPVHAYPSLPKGGENILFFTSLIVKEISQTLYGFLSQEERDFFEQVLAVSGIGPKIALSLIGHIPLPEIVGAIASNNAQKISAVPGIGKKTAERLIIELRDKIGKNAKHSLLQKFSIPLENNPLEQNALDAVRALINLGYHPSAAEKAVAATVKDQHEPQDVAVLITAALKHVRS